MELNLILVKPNQCKEKNKTKTNKCGKKIGTCKTNEMTQGENTEVLKRI